MAVTTYETIDGEILGETRGGVERDYVPDPLGSVAALIDSSQAKTDTFTYWPYGEERSRTGTTPTPFRFVGTYGYYRDDSGRAYVRARHLSTKSARWLSVDPLWPGESAYGYAGGRPATFRDPSSLGGFDPLTCLLSAYCPDPLKIVCSIKCHLRGATFTGMCLPLPDRDGSWPWCDCDKQRRWWPKLWVGPPFPPIWLPYPW